MTSAPQVTYSIYITMAPKFSSAALTSLLSPWSQACNWCAPLGAHGETQRQHTRKRSSRSHPPREHHLSTPASPPRATAREPRCASPSPCLSPPTATDMSKPVHSARRWHPESLRLPSLLLPTPRRRPRPRPNLASRELLLVSGHLCHCDDAQASATFSVINDQGFHFRLKRKGVS